MHNKEKMAQALYSIHGTYHKPNDTVAENLRELHELSRVLNIRQFTPDILTYLRDVEIVCRYMDNKSALDGNRMADLIACLVKTLHKVKLGDDVSKYYQSLLYSTPIIDRVVRVAHVAVVLYQGGNSNKSSLHYKEPLNYNEIVNIVNLLDNANTEMVSILKLLTELSYTCEVLKWGIPQESATLSKWYGYADIVGLQTSFGKQRIQVETQKKDTSEDTVALAIANAKRITGLTNIVAKNGTLYDMDAINSGYNEMARVGSVKSYARKTVKPQGQVKKGLISRLFGRS